MEFIGKNIEFIVVGAAAILFLLIKISAISEKEILFIKDILAFIQKKAEEYEIYRLEKLISSILPVLYFVAENTLQKGKEKKKFVVEKITESLNLENLSSTQKKKVADYINTAIETLNFTQKNESSELAKSVLEKVLSLKFPIISFVFYIIRKVVAK